MNQSLNRKKFRQPRFDVINRYNVAIKSLRNQLKTASGIDELTNIASKIIELEQQIMIEKSIGYQRLKDNKKQIKYKIDKLQRELNQAEGELSQIDTKLTFKINGYRKTLQARIDSLNIEYQAIVGFMKYDELKSAGKNKYSTL